MDGELRAGGEAGGGEAQAPRLLSVCNCAIIRRAAQYKVTEADTAETSMPNVRPLAVLFDLDGTLIDSIELILNSARHAFRERIANVPTDAEWLKDLGKPLTTMFRPYARDDGDVQTLIGKYREYQLANHDRLVRSYELVVETVHEIRTAGHPVAIVTSKTVQLARRGLDHVGLGAHFDVIVGYDSCDRHKPDPFPVELALEQLRYRPFEAVFVGDSVHDMAAGNAAGVATIAALWGPFSREDLTASNPSHYLQRMADLPGMLQGIEAGRNKGSK
jgi:pyrophosphatase PpaX